MTRVSVTREQPFLFLLIVLLVQYVMSLFYSHSKLHIVLLFDFPIFLKYRNGGRLGIVEYIGEGKGASQMPLQIEGEFHSTDQLIK